MRYDLSGWLSSDGFAAGDYLPCPKQAAQAS